MAIFCGILASLLLREIIGFQLDHERKRFDKVSPQWPGLTASLDEAGYQYLVAMEDGGQMWRFMRRLIASRRAIILDEAAFNKFLETVAQSRGKKNFETVLQNLQAASWLTGFSADTLFEENPQEYNDSRTSSVNLFIAGIEGSGHSFIKDVMDSCVLAGRCMIDPELTRSLWDSREDKALLAESWRDAAIRDENEIRAPKKLRVLNAYDRTDHAGELTYTGMMSYPSFSASWYPRLDLYSEVAKEAGDKLFALVLVRDPSALLCSDILRFTHNEEVEIAALNALVTQLQKLPPSAYHCLDYDTMPSMPPDLQLFLGTLLQVDTSISQVVEEHYKVSSANCAESAIASDVIERFAEAQEPLYRLCMMADRAPAPIGVYS